MISIKVDDWVRMPSLVRGVWKVSRVVSGFKEDRWSLDDPLQPSKRTLLFCHRLFNDSWQRAFFTQSCEASLAQVISPPDLEMLKSLLSANRKLSAAFEKYRTTAKPIDLVANVGFGGMNKKEIEEFPHICSDLFTNRIDEGLTMDQVLSALRERGVDARIGQSPNQATLQLGSRGHELRGDRFVYRRFRTLGF